MSIDPVDWKATCLHREKEIIKLENDIKLFKAMKDGVEVRIDDLTKEVEKWKNQAESLQKNSKFKKDYDPKWRKAYEKLEAKNDTIGRDLMFMAKENAELKVSMDRKIMIIRKYHHKLMASKKEIRQFIDNAAGEDI